MAMKQQSELLKSAKLILRDPLGLLGLVIVIALVGSAIFAPSLAPFNPTAIDMKARLSAPTAVHWLGTDQLGRDAFSRMILGGRVALQVALPSIAAALGIGLLLGMVAGYGPRWLDNAIMLLFDTLRSFPTVMLALSFVALVGPSLGTVMLVVIVTSAPIYGRIARTQTMTLKSSEFITAEEAMGARMPRILLIHILPNILGTLVVLASMDIPAVIALEAGLSFLGMGVKPPTPSWGSLLKDGYALIRSTPWLIIAGAFPIVMTTLGFTFLGEALRDVADPKLRRTR
jgi:peptide/nickel transport system permease protein